jgi:hypothetical protein
MGARVNLMTLGRLRERFRKRLAGIADSWSSRIPTIRATAQKFEPQRMCPFCNLITPRSRRSCVECGKAFGNT